MIWRRKPLKASTLLIIMIKVFSGETLTCHPAEYLIGGECCPKCPAGGRVKTDCTEFRSTSCLPCIDGTYMDKPTGKKECLLCTVCDAVSGLKVKISCTATSDTVCEPLEGFYCSDRIGENCVTAQKHRTCQPGQYINQTGTASTDTVCSDCSAGTFSDGRSPSCRPHTQCKSINLQLIKAGTTSADAECGEGSSNVAVAVIIPVILFLSIVSAGLVYFFYFRNKKTCLNSGKKRRPGIPGAENGDTELSSERLKPASPID